jgi:predicted nucleotide-binding protein
LPSIFNTHSFSADYFSATGLLEAVLANMANTHNANGHLRNSLRREALNGRTLLAIVDCVQAHNAFERWIAAVVNLLVASPLHDDLVAQWAALKNSRLVSFGQYFDNVEARSDFQKAVEQRIAWISEVVGRLGYELTPITENEPMSEKRASPSPDPRTVFVVHGRNILARDAMFELLSAFGLRPLEWDEALRLTGKASPYIGEILDAAFAAAQAIIVILTGEDVAMLRPSFRGSTEQDHDSKPTPQARLNVIFEAGMALGRNPDRTIMVELEHTRPFSDVAGRHTIRFRGSSEDRQSLKTRLETAGCEISAAGVRWLSSGNFAGALSFSEGSLTHDKATLVEEAATTKSAELQVSPTAMQILKAAGKFDGTILVLDTSGGFVVQANQVNLVVDQQPRTQALYRDAIRELQRLDLINQMNEGIYQVTTKGYNLLDLELHNKTTDGEKS